MADQLTLFFSRVLWGFCMFGMGFVHNWSGLMAARFFLGVTEAGLFPGVNYYISCWYRRDEVAIRAVSDLFIAIQWPDLRHA